MNLIGLMPARNEDWCLGLTARAAMLWCDALVILNHASTDRTEAITDELVAEAPHRILRLRESETRWDEMRHRDRALRAAREWGATHIAIIDADEILTGNVLDSIRKRIEQPGRHWMTELPGYNLRGSLYQYHSNGIWGKRWFSLAFADDERLHWAGDRFHHREPMGMRLSQWHPYGQGEGGVMHLWGVSKRRLLAKHALYKMTETLRWPAKSRTEIDRNYNLAFDPGADPRFEQQWAYAQVPAAWWEPYAHLMKYLDAEADPWQEAECRRLLAQHGAERFAGLNLFGIAEQVAA